MNLYLMRHAEAADLGAEGATSDADRPLTEKGQGQAQLMGRLLRRLDVKLELVLTSPFARARETADLLIEEYGGHVDILDDETFVPDGAESDMWATIARTSRSRVLAVGHLPSIGDLAAALMGSRAAQPLHFHKASLAALVTDDGHRRPHATLEWMVWPSVARRLLR